MDPDAERLQRRADLGGDRGVQFPGADRGQHGIFGKGAVQVHAQDLHVPADVLEAGRALETVAAGDVRLSRHPVPRLEVLDPLSHLHHLGGIFVTEQQREPDA